MFVFCESPATAINLTKFRFTFPIMVSISTVNYFSERWFNSGVKSGDTLLLHSSLKRTLMEGRNNGFTNLSVEDVLDSFLDALGADGTLLLPLFNFDFTKGVIFDFNHSPSQMGGLTEVGRMRPNAVRTGHPIYSFCAIGKNADVFEMVDNESGYGPDSPFGILCSLDGKIGVLDLDDQNSMTFYHHVEEMLEVDYRYFKKFSGLYKDQNEKVSVKTYSLFVRNLEKGIQTHVNPAGELMWAKGLYNGFRPGSNSGLRVVSANKMFDFVSQIIRDGYAEYNLYRQEVTK